MPVHATCTTAPVIQRMRRRLARSSCVNLRQSDVVDVEMRAELMHSAVESSAHDVLFT